MVPPRSGHQRSILFNQDWDSGDLSDVKVDGGWSVFDGEDETLSGEPLLLSATDRKLSNSSCPLSGIHTETSNFFKPDNL